MPHQLTGGKFLADRAFALLLDDPGLGKTATAIRGADLAGARKILTLCPAAVRPHWAREWARWQRLDRPVTLLEGLPKAPLGPGVTIASHEALARAPDRLRAGAPYDLIIVDESMIYREWKAKRTQNFARAQDAQFINGQGKLETLHKGAWSWAERVWCLTGTPIVNSAADLWPLFYGPLRCKVTWYDFCRQFAERMVPTFSGDKAVGLKNAPELANMLRPVALRRTLDSVGIPLPPLSVQSVSYDLPAAEMATIMAGLEGWTPDRLVAALENSDDLKDANLMRVRRVLGLAKIYGIGHYARQRAVDHGEAPVVVFFQHTGVREGLQTMLGAFGFRVGVIDGKVTPKSLAATESGFQAGQFDVLLAQTQSAGQGLTLHRSNTCVSGEMPWTATALQQSHKRIHRIGQKRPCTATILQVKGCWLEDVMANIVTKKHKASELLLSLLTTNT